LELLAALIVAGRHLSAEGGEVLLVAASVCRTGDGDFLFIHFLPFDVEYFPTSRETILKSSNLKI
jgi:hypothetical protein